MKLPITLIAYLLISSTKLWACTCIGEASTKEAFNHSDLVITGMVIDSEIIRIWSDTTDARYGFDYWVEKHVLDSTTNYEEWKENNIDLSIQMIDYTIVVEDRLKGGRRKDTLVVRTGFGHGDCGFQFRIGEKYLIYARHEKGIKYNHEILNRTRKELRGIYRTTICTRTKLMSFAAEELTELSTF